MLAGLFMPVRPRPEAQKPPKMKNNCIRMWTTTAK